MIGFPHRPGEGGPGSFQIRIETALKERGWRVAYPDDDAEIDVILVVGGTRKLWWLVRNRMKGVPIVQRLAGMNWIHEVRSLGVRLHFRIVVGDLLMKTIRRYLSDGVVYQSTFARDWWHRGGGAINVPEYVVYNAVPLDVFFPQKGTGYSKSIVCAEGTLDYSPWSVDVVNQLQEILSPEPLFGGIRLYGRFADVINESLISKDVRYSGSLPRNSMPGIYRNNIFLSLDVNAACPNSVIEALASGAPVIGFDTGSLRELVPDTAGVLVPYGADPWRLEMPDVHALAEAAKKVLENWDAYSCGARTVAVERFGIQQMTEAYLDVIFDVLKKRKEKNR